MEYFNRPVLFKKPNWEWLQKNKKDNKVIPHQLINELIEKHIKKEEE